MTATATRAITFEEFLRLPETEPPSEFICGEVVPKPMPTWTHGTIVNVLGAFLMTYLLKHRLGSISSESRHAYLREERVFLPDIAVLLHARGPLAEENLDRGPVERVPDMAVEVLSPGDRPSRVAEKIDFYLRSGVPLVWVIDPDDETLDAFVPGEPAKRYTRMDTATGAPVLPGFSLSIDELFSTVEALRTPAD